MGNKSYTDRDGEQAIAEITIRIVYYASPDGRSSAVSRVAAQVIETRGPAPDFQPPPLFTSRRVFGPEPWEPNGSELRRMAASCVDEFLGPWSQAAEPVRSDLPTATEYAMMHHEPIKMAGNYHPRVFLYLEQVAAILEELPPERWPDWAVSAGRGYRSDFMSPARCCGENVLARGYTCTGGAFELSDDVQVALNDAILTRLT